MNDYSGGCNVLFMVKGGGAVFASNRLVARGVIQDDY